MIKTQERKYFKKNLLFRKGNLIPGQSSLFIHSSFNFAILPLPPPIKKKGKNGFFGGAGVDGIHVFVN